jgi:chromosomal replication initiation ATPase DnaA
MHFLLILNMIWIEYATKSTHRCPKKLSRVSGPQNEKRDLIVYLIWQTGLLTNEKIGAIFDLTYSSVSHSVRAVKARMAKDHKFSDYFDGLNSQFKV